MIIKKLHALSLGRTQYITFIRHAVVANRSARIVFLLRDTGPRLVDLGPHDAIAVSPVCGAFAPVHEAFQHPSNPPCEQV